MSTPHRRALTLIAVMLGLCSCGKYPEPIGSTFDVLVTPATQTQIVITGLPLDEWPRLRKFQKVECITVAAQMAEQVGDGHLRVLGELGFPALRDLSLADCGHVTDAGVRCLTNLVSLRSLQLMGTAVTDQGIALLSKSLPALSGLNVWRCNGLTAGGFQSLTNSRSLSSVGLSVGRLSQGDIEGIVMTVTNVRWWTIEDAQRRLDLNHLAELGRQKGVRLQLSDGSSIIGIEEAKQGQVWATDARGR